jgi:hypothetical protein
MNKTELVKIIMKGTIRQCKAKDGQSVKYSAIHVGKKISITVSSNRAYTSINRS